MTTKLICDNTEHVAGGNVVHTRAVGQDDALHYILSTVGVPTVLVFHTARDSTPSINCTRLLSDNISDVENSITFSHSPFYTYALMFTKVRHGLTAKLICFNGIASEVNCT